MTHQLVIGSFFEYKGSNFRVGSFVRSVDNAWWEYTLPENATHVFGKGICGCIAPINEVTDQHELPDWSEQLWLDIRASEAAKIGRRILI
jgi:hypothetical protein